MMISAVTLVLLFAGGIINYIQAGTLNAELGGIMACNMAIFACAMDKYNKAKKQEDA